MENKRKSFRPNILALIASVKLAPNFLLAVLYHYALEWRLNRLVEHYFAVWRTIHQSDWLALSVEQKAHIQAVKLLMVGTFVRSVQFVVLSCVELDIYWRVLLWDQMLFLGANRNLNLAYIIYGLGSIYNIGQFYFLSWPKHRRGAIWLVQQSLWRGDARWKNVPLMQVSPEKVRWLLRNFIFIAKYGFFTWQIIPYYYLALILYYIWLHYTYFFTTLIGLASLFAIAFNGLITVFLMHVTLTQYTLKFLLVSFFAYVQFRKLKQIGILLSKCNGRTNFKRSVCNFTRWHTEILLDVFEANRLFGNTISACLIMCTPTSAYQLMLILTQELEPMGFWNHLTVIAYEWLMIFAIHFMATQYTKNLHSFGRPLMCLIARRSIPDMTKLDPASQIKLAFYVEKFHLKKRHYGITYSSYGLMSVGSFSKFILLYSELLLYCYKILNLNSI